MDFKTCPKCKENKLYDNRCLACNYFDKKVTLDKISELEGRLEKVQNMLNANPPLSDVYSPNMIDQSLPKQTLPKGFKPTLSTPNYIKGTLPKGYRISAVSNPSSNSVKYHFNQYGVNKNASKKHETKPIKITTFNKLLLGLGLAKPKVNSKNLPSNKRILPKEFQNE